jgi:hypothetical protein
LVDCHDDYFPQKKKIYGVGKNITLDEFETVPLLLRRRVKLDEVNNLYFFLIQIQSNFKRTKRDSFSKKHFVNIKELINKGYISSGRKGILPFFLFLY